jgi:hypothetical protein
MELDEVAGQMSACTNEVDEPRAEVCLGAASCPIDGGSADGSQCDDFSGRTLAAVCNEVEHIVSLGSS